MWSVPLAGWWSQILIWRFEVRTSGPIIPHPCHCLHMSFRRISLRPGKIGLVSDWQRYRWGCGDLFLKKHARTYGCRAWIQVDFKLWLVTFSGKPSWINLSIAGCDIPRSPSPKASSRYDLRHWCHNVELTKAVEQVATVGWISHVTGLTVWVLSSPPSNLNPPNVIWNRNSQVKKSHEAPPGNYMVASSSYSIIVSHHHQGCVN